MNIQEFRALSNVEQQQYIALMRPATTISIARRRLICGFGINDASYTVQPEIDGERVFCPAYQTWLSMIRRVYGSDSDRSFDGFKICIEWSKFTEFAKWWADNQVDGWGLDKDILGDSNMLSGESCLYIPTWLNQFINMQSYVRGKFPIGANFHKASGKFRGTCHNPITQKSEHLGLFENQHLAHSAWKERKLEFAKRLKHKMDEIDGRIYPRVVEIINRAK